MGPVILSIGLIGLIDPLSQLSGIVKAYRSFTPDPDALNTQFEAGRRQFERWKRSYGPDTQLSADPQTRLVVEDLVSVLDFVFETKESIHQAKRTKSPPLKNSISGTVNHHHIRDADAGLKRRKLTWALGRKRDPTDLVTQFGKVVQQVHDLMLPKQAASTQSVTNRSLKETLRNTDPRANMPNLEHDCLAMVHKALTELRRALEKAQGEYGVFVLRLKLMKADSRHETRDS